MIDFRYLLITIVAIFLALTIGIVTGAGFLGEPLREGLESSVARVQDDNDRLQGEINGLQTELDDSREFGDSAEEWVTRDRLTGEEFVVFTFDGTNGALLDSVRDALADAGGQLVSTINFSDRFALQNEPERELLADIIGSVSSDPAELRRETARFVANAFGAAARGEQDPAGDRLQSLEAFDEEGFVSIDRTDSGSEAIPPGATFIVVGGATDEPPFPVAQFVERLSVTLIEGGTQGLVTESSVSVWRIVQTIRESGAARSVVSTVDQIERVEGRVAMVLAIDLLPTELAQHYGTGTGADLQVPEPPDGE